MGWLLLLIHLFISVFVGNFIASQLQEQQCSNNLDQAGKIVFEIQNNNEFEENTLIFSNKYKFFMAGFAAGFIGSTLGIGGGPILIPIWLRYSFMTSN